MEYIVAPITKFPINNDIRLEHYYISAIPGHTDTQYDDHKCEPMSNGTQIKFVSFQPNYVLTSFPINSICTGDA